MSSKRKIYEVSTQKKMIERLLDDLNNANAPMDFILLYAFNGTGKTRLSMAFKDHYRVKRGGRRNTLYFNAYTEDLFTWNNDFENHLEHHLEMNMDSNFFNAVKNNTKLEDKIEKYLQRYAKFNFDIRYQESRVVFSIGDKTNIKVSRGEENIFVWCFFLAICELALDGDPSYDWVRYFYIDDPISSLDDNNAIAVATDLAKLLKRARGKIKAVLSSHHALFYNVMCNELKHLKGSLQYFLHTNNAGKFVLQKTDETPYFHHVAMLSELKEADVAGEIKTYHFNILRSILEKTSSFFGYNDFTKCISGLDDQVLFERAVQLLSHGSYSLFDPVVMGDDTKELFRRVLDGFLSKYEFHLPAFSNNQGNPTQNP
jgi:wobble nucleotide-excising tRNase